MFIWILSTNLLRQLLCQDSWLLFVWAVVVLCYFSWDCQDSRLPVKSICQACRQFCGAKISWIGKFWTCHKIGTSVLYGNMEHNFPGSSRYRNALYLPELGEQFFNFLICQRRLLHFSFILHKVKNGAGHTRHLPTATI